MSFIISSDNHDQFFDAETFLSRGGHAGAEEACMDVVPLDSVRRLSFDPTVEAKGVNGYLSHFPIAAHDGFHNCRQYYSDPYLKDGDSSAASLSLNEAVEAEEGSMSWSSGYLGASPQQRKAPANTAAAVADNVMQGPVLLAGMTKAVHYLTSMFEDDDLDEDRATSTASEVRRETVAEENETAEAEPSTQMRPDKKNIIRENQTVHKHSTQSAAKTARAAK